MINETEIWNVIYTKIKSEAKVGKRLTRKGFEIYIPETYTKSIYSSRRSVSNKVFPGFIFIKTSKFSHSKIKKVYGVIDFLYWLDQPAVIHQEDVDEIRKFTLEYQNVRAEKSLVKSNGEMKLLTNPEMTREGNILEIKHRAIVIAIPRLGFNLIATLEKNKIDIASQPKEPTISKAINITSKP